MNLLDSLPKIKVEEAAQHLLGQNLVHETNGHKLVAKIVETEAYHEDDPAAHTFNGQTERNRVMFGPAGRAYIYLSYGIHHCLNVVTGQEGRGEAVLIRAAEPVEGATEMHKNRFSNCHSEFISESLPNETQILKRVQDDKHYHNLTNGPGKLTEALGIGKELGGHNLNKPPLQLETGEKINTSDIITTTRIGISKAADKPLRFYIKNNPFVSKK